MEKTANDGDDDDLSAISDMTKGMAEMSKDELVEKCKALSLQLNKSKSSKGSPPDNNEKPAVTAVRVEKEAESVSSSSSVSSGSSESSNSSATTKTSATTTPGEGGSAGVSQLAGGE